MIFPYPPPIRQFYRDLSEIESNILDSFLEYRVYENKRNMKHIELCFWHNWIQKTCIIFGVDYFKICKIASKIRTHIIENTY